MNWIVSSKPFGLFMIFCIVLNACFMAAYDPLTPNTSERNRVVDVSDNVFLAIYSAEAVAKVLRASILMNNYLLTNAIVSGSSLSTEPCCIAALTFVRFGIG